MDLNSIRRVHMIGIGGIGVSALARLFHHEGKVVSGSDRTASEVTRGLEALGIDVQLSQRTENITDEIELVVYTEAMPKHHEEMVAARERGILMLSYFEALGLVANEYYLIAVAGTHGKTTTTAMLTDILEAADFDPTAVIGSLRAKTGSNFRPGKSKYMVVEACEYRRDFLSLTPDVLVITNIEAEHLDYYKDLSDVQDAFRELTARVREGGAIVAHSTHETVSPVLVDLCTTVTVIDYTKQIDLLLSLKVPGLHNQMNAAAANAAALFVGVTPLTAKAALEGFAGTWRRFEYKGEVQGAPVYDDYGHHPTEIQATLQGTRELFPDKKVLLIYQPHLDSRTEKLFDDFVEALSAADELVLYPAYAARDVGGSHNSTARLAAALTNTGKNVTYLETFDAIEQAVKSRADADYVILVMGAGDITEVATRLTAQNDTVSVSRSE